MSGEGMYGRYARDLSVSLFNSVYTDLYRRAEREQAAIWVACPGKTFKAKRKHYRIGDAQLTLNAFCEGRLSLGEALDFLTAHPMPEAA